MEDRKKGKVVTCCHGNELIQCSWFELWLEMPGGGRMITSLATEAQILRAAVANIWAAVLFVCFLLSAPCPWWFFNNNPEKAIQCWVGSWVIIQTLRMIYVLVTWHLSKPSWFGATVTTSPPLLSFLLPSFFPEPTLAASTHQGCCLKSQVSYLSSEESQGWLNAIRTTWS